VARLKEWAEDRFGVVCSESGIMGSSRVWSRGGLEVLVCIELVIRITYFLGTELRQSPVGENIGSSFLPFLHCFLCK
jgi:hypothetical protein